MNSNTLNILLGILVGGLLGWTIAKNIGNENQSKTNTAAIPEGFDLAGATAFDVDGTDIKLIETRNADGKIQEQGQLQGSLKTGVWITFHPEERPKTITSYAGGKLNGLYLELNNRGMVEKECNYKDGFLDGKFATYRSGSRKLEEHNYIAGQLHGLVRKYNDRTGKIQQEINYKNGLQHGSIKYYDEEGNVTMEYEYKDGEKVSGGMVKK